VQPFSEEAATYSETPRRERLRQFRGNNSTRRQPGDAVPFWQKNGTQRLAKPVGEYMQQRFRLLPEYLGEPRCFEYHGVINEKPVRYIAGKDVEPAAVTRAT